ncbi:MAG: PqqD family peptide modification chaperone [Chitinivibrionales bacterium]|nr:PqqD family peptide modification chaperone [Chitinivibrionales bacterium]
MARKRASAQPQQYESVDPRRRDPLNATPVVAPDVEARTDTRSLVQLRRDMPAQSRMSVLLRRWFHYKRYVRVNLDECGTAFWKQIDGRRDLHGIERNLRKRFGWSEEQSVAAIVGFTKMLMLRGLICLRLPGQEAAEGVPANG